MIYLKDTDISAFSYKYNIKPSKEICRKCGKEVDVNNPVISSDYVGFESTPHEPCGLGFRITILKAYKTPDWHIH
jgi:hypothetical protein